MKLKLNPSGNLSNCTCPLGKILKGGEVVGAPGLWVVVLLIGPVTLSCLKIAPAKCPAKLPDK